MTVKYFVTSVIRVFLHCAVEVLLFAPLRWENVSFQRVRLIWSLFSCVLFVLVLVEQLVPCRAVTVHTAASVSRFARMDLSRRLLIRQQCELVPPGAAERPAGEEIHRMLQRFGPTSLVTVKEKWSSGRMKADDADSGSEPRCVWRAERTELCADPHRETRTDFTWDAPARPGLLHTAHRWKLLRRRSLSVG